MTVNKLVLYVGDELLNRLRTKARDNFRNPTQEAVYLLDKATRGKSTADHQGAATGGRVTTDHAAGQESKP